MKKIAFVLGLVLLPASAWAEQPPATVEQRLAVQIANLTLQLAHAGAQIDLEKKQIEELTAKLKTAEPPKTEGTTPTPP